MTETGRYLLVVRPIVLKGEIIGSVRLQADEQRHPARLKMLAATVGVLILTSWLVALALSTGLQRFISKPILTLANVARAVQERKDYSLRAEKQSKDEIGALVDGFNQMLTHVQARDEELRASEERFRQLAENISEVFWMTDIQKRRMIYVSPGYEIIWGRTRESLYAEPKSWIGAVHADDRERVCQASLTKQASGDYDEEYRIVRPNQEVRWIRDRAYPVRDADGTVYRIVGIAEDITTLKCLEEEILDISDCERRRIGQDIHDGLCQHLTGTAFAAKTLEGKLAASDSPEAADVGEIARLIEAAIAQAHDVAQGLSPVQLEPHGLMTALDQLTGNVSSLFDVTCTFSCQQAVHLRDNAVAVHLYRIAQEAVNNAIKHGRPKHVWVALTSVNGRVNLTVEDDGLGIAEARGQRNGMGLHIMAYRARMISGLLDVQRQEGGGTIVTCSVEDTPHRVQEKGADRSMTAYRKHPEDRSKVARILVVDDHPIVREHLKALIEQQKDLKVCASVADAAQAMKAITALQPDLAIVDLSLKGTHGLDLIKDMAVNHPQLPVLVLSMHDELLFADRVLAAGARGYITKQEATSRIMTAIRKVLEGEIYASDRMTGRILHRAVEGDEKRPGSSLSQLTGRELQVFQLIGHGLTTRQIAEQLHLDIKTIETYRMRIKEKLHLGSATALLQYAVQWMQNTGAS